MTWPALLGRRRRAAGLLPLILVAIVVVATCTRVPTDPTVVFSLAVDSLPSPSVVAGDTMRDTNGIVHPLSGRSYNVQGQVLTSVRVRFISLSPSQLTIDSTNHAVGAGQGDSIVRVVADANGVETPMPLADFIDIGVFSGKKDEEKPLYMKREGCSELPEVRTKSVAAKASAGL